MVGEGGGRGGEGVVKGVEDVEGGRGIWDRRPAVHRRHKT